MFVSQQLLRLGTKYQVVTRSFRTQKLRIPTSVRYQSSKSHSTSNSEEKYWAIGGAALLVTGHKHENSHKVVPLAHTTVNENIPESTEKNLEASEEAKVPYSSESSDSAGINTDDETSQSSDSREPEASVAEKTPEDIIESNPVQESPVETEATPENLENKQTTKGLKVKVYYKYVLVGGGTASYSAMQAIKLKEPSAEVLIISEEPTTPYMRPPLSKELWFSEEKEVATTLKFKDWQGAERNVIYGSPDMFELVDSSTLLASSDSRTKIITGCPVTKLDVDRKVLHLKNGHRIAYDKILLATGGLPKTLDIVQTLPDTVQSRITNYRNLADYRALEGLAKEGKQVAVVGGGFLGSELAFALAQHGRQSGTQVTQIYPESGNMAAVFPPYLTKWTSERLAEEGVKIIPKSFVTNISLREDGKVNIQLNGENQLGNQVENQITVENQVENQITVENQVENQITVDHVVIAVGISPNDQLARDSGLEIDPKRGGILVNAELESRGGVFAAGDVTSYHDIALGRRRVEHHDHAALSGRHAGENMVGPKKPYRHQSMFWSDLGPKIGYEAVGLVDSSLKTSSMWIKDNHSNPDSNQFNKGLVFYFKDDRLVGVMLWNLFGKVDIARQLIRLNKFGPDHVKELSAQFNLYDSSVH